MDPDGNQRSIGYEHAPMLLRTAPTCWLYGPTTPKNPEPVLVMFAQDYVNVARGCTSNFLAYRSTRERPFDLRTWTTMGVACHEDLTDFDVVMGFFELAYDFEQRGDEVVLLGEKGKELSRLRPSPSTC